MFRKKRASLNPPPNQTPTPNAATAAAQAFLKKQVDDGGLSSAAAAAALRSHTSSPAPVGDTQTKRMARRGSNSSLGSGTGSARPPFSSNLQRRGSNGSMTQRTFRSPSPGRHNATPPVPALPNDLPPLPNEKIPPVPKKSHMRTSSQEPMSRPFSPTPKKGTRASSLDNSQWAGPKNQQPSAPSNLQSVVEQKERRPQANQGSPRESPRSINFSRPMSPPASPRMAAEGPDALSVGTSRPTKKPPPSTSFGLSPEEYKRLHQQGRGRGEQGSEPARGRVLKQGAGGAETSIESSKHAVPTGPATTGARAAAHVSENGNTAAREPSTTGTSGTATSPRRKKKRPSLDSIDAPSTPANPARTAAVRVTPRPASMSGPTPEQIRAFQTRAAAMLARPLTDSPSVPKPTPKSRTSGHDGPRPRAGTSDVYLGSASKNEAQHNRVVSQPNLTTPGLTMSIGRTQSISPTRSAHFLDSPMLEVMKHQPPPRSTSPVKPALKTSVSPRPKSPVGSPARDDGYHSDARSLLSEDSSVPTSKKKKAVRVSFEEKPVLVGQAAEETDSPAAGPLSPQFKKSLRDVETLDDPAAHMAPRPALPSFGSVRGRKGLKEDLQRDESQASEETTDEPATLPPTASPIETPEETLEKKQASQIMRDHGFNEAEDEKEASKIAQLGDELMPSIAIQPATPLMEDKDVFSHPESDTPTDPDVPSDNNATIPADVPKVSSHSAIEATPVVGPQDGLAVINREDLVERESDDSDVFSDAAEEPSELEDDGGFASLDAILESPQVESAPIIAPLSPSQPQSQVEEDMPEGPTAITSDTAVPAPTEDWSLVSAYWSSLSDQKKQEMEQQARKEPEPEQEPPPIKAVPDELKKESKKKRVVSPPAQPTQPSPKPLKSAMKKSVAANNDDSPTDQVHLRKSMRSGGTLRPSGRDGPKPVAKQQARPLSADVSPATAKGMAQRAPRPTSEIIPSKSGPKPGLTRVGSDDSSASDSSFKKKRRNSASSTGSGKYSMRRSMRDEQPPPMPSKRVASPPASFRKSMRTSPRGSSDFGSPERRGSRQSSSFLGFRKSPKPPKAKVKKGTGPPGGPSRFRSRFDDSSDEDNVRSAFRSRFADSDDSDEEAPHAAKLAPVRGIPRKVGQNEGESTDLSDSEEERLTEKTENRPPTPPAQNLLNMISAAQSPDEKPEEVKAEEPEPRTNGNAQGTALNAGTLRAHDMTKEEKASKRSSFFGIGRKRDTSTSDLTASKWASDSETTSSPLKSHTLRETPKSPRSESGAPTGRTWSLLRRTGASAPTSAQSSPGVHHGASKAGEFPFPPPPIPEEYKGEYNNANGDQRPNTSDGSITAKRRSILDRSEKRQSINTDPRPGDEGASNEAPSSPRVVRVESGPRSAGGKLQKQRTPVYSERTGRKKKFQGLRRVFGLND